MEIIYVFSDYSTTRAASANWIPPFDSAHRIGLFTRSRGVLTVNEGGRGLRFEICRIWNIFTCARRTIGDEAKRMVRLDSTRQIGPSTISKGVLTVVEGVYGRETENLRNWLHF